LGGSIVWNYTLVHPEKDSKLILVDAGGFTSSTKPKGAIGFKLAQMPVMNQLLKVITPKFLVKKSLEDAYGDKTKVTTALVDQYYDMVLRTGNRQAIIDRMQKGFGSNASDKIKEIKTPTLIIWGDKDQLIPVDCAYLFKKNIVNSELIILKGIGHVPMEESPDQFSQLVNRFLISKPQ
jgi:pimeloyl-ACP methyl ester carboxylesterase